MKECVILVDFFTAKKCYSPTPGIEPGPPGWKPGILAIRPRGIYKTKWENGRFKTNLSNALNYNTSMAYFQTDQVFFLHFVILKRMWEILIFWKLLSVLRKSKDLAFEIWDMYYLGILIPLFLVSITHRDSISNTSSVGQCH